LPLPAGTITHTLTSTTLHSLLDAGASGTATLDGNVSGIDEALRHLVVTCTAITNTGEFVAPEHPGDFEYALAANGVAWSNLHCRCINPKLRQLLKLFLSQKRNSVRTSSGMNLAKAHWGNMNSISTVAAGIAKQDCESGGKP
jgi:hypothetical protein